MLPAFASGNSSIAMDRHKKITISHQIAMDRHKQIAKRPSRSQSPSPPCEAPVIGPRIVLVPPFEAPVTVANPQESAEFVTPDDDNIIDVD